jgi:ubiquitin-small subunit ribosomal protein S27Ae
MAKARVGLYNTKGDVLARTHKTCPKCGPGTFLAEHANRRSCGKCGYMESKANEPKSAAAPIAKPEAKPGAKAKAPKAPGGPAPGAKPAAPAAAPKTPAA